MLISLLSFPLESILLLLAVCVAGTAAGIVVGCLPGFHVYTLLGLGLVAVGSRLSGPAADLVPAFVVAAVTAWAIVGTIPAVLLSAPDESAVFTVLPGQRYLLQGRGVEAILLLSLGSACALVTLAPLAWLMVPALPALHRVLTPHYHWILWVTITFMLLSEWPQGRTAGLTRAPVVERVAERRSRPGHIRARRPPWPHSLQPVATAGGGGRPRAHARVCRPVRRAVAGAERR